MRREMRRKIVHIRVDGIVRLTILEGDGTAKKTE
jgi:hypothetical protein